MSYFLKELHEKKSELWDKKKVSYLYFLLCGDKKTELRNVNSKSEKNQNLRFLYLPVLFFLSQNYKFMTHKKVHIVS